MYKVQAESRKYSFKVINFGRKKHEDQQQISKNPRKKRKKAMDPTYMVLYANSLSLYEQPRRGICHENHEHRSYKFFLATGKIFKIPNQFLEIRLLLYTPSGR